MVCLPIGIIILCWNEYQAVHAFSVFPGVSSILVTWGCRALGFIWLLFCYHRIFSAAKLFMSRIPLTYNEIRNVILFQSFITASVTSLVIISICRIYDQPRISLVLAGVSVALIFATLIRRRRKKQLEKGLIPSVKPQQAKDV